MNYLSTPIDCCLFLELAIQTVLRREGFDKPYEALKSLTRTGEDFTLQQLETFINNLSVSDKVKEELKRITPFSFIGVLPKERNPSPTTNTTTTTFQ
jgi:adenylosuccinate lyase